MSLINRLTLLNNNQIYDIKLQNENSSWMISLVIMYLNFLFVFGIISF